MPKTPKDIRSTGRKRARKVLFKSGRIFECADCHQGPTSLPPDASKSVRLPPMDRRTVTGLQADHENKNLLDNDPANLNWRCPSCHKIRDKQTAKGISTKGSDEHGYGLELL